MGDLHSSGLDAMVIYPMADAIYPTLHRLGLSPNMVTTLTLLLRLVAIHLFLQKKKPWAVGLLYFVSIITDACDGKIARKYNQVSKWGSLYDHMVDIVTTLTVLGIIVFKYKQYNTITILPLITLCYIFLIRSKQFGKHLSDTESVAYTLIPSINPKYMKWASVVDAGTCTGALIVVMLYTMTRL
jgi:phosphatidylglycerophosphate synthase